MGERGRPPRPTGLKLLAGERPSRINADEPVPMGTRRPPPCPARLQGEARREWRRRARELHAKGMLKPWDHPLFEAWCVQVQVYERAYHGWADADFAPTVTGERGGTVKHPCLQVMRDAGALMLSISKRFGFTPSDRAGIEMPMPTDPEVRELMTPKRHRGPAPAP